jgi:hypothetical protein
VSPRKIGKNVSAAHRLARHRAEQREQHQLQIAPASERLAQRILRELARGAHLAEHGRLFELHADVDGNREQDDRQQEGHAPAPSLEVLAEQPAAAEDHDERQDHARSRRDLNPARVVSAAARRGVFRDVSRGAAVLAADGETLQQSQRDQDDRRRDADRRLARQHTDERRGDAHEDDGDQERVLAAREVAEPAEDQRAEGPHCETRGECEQREDKRGRLIDADEELFADDRRERAVEVEVVPLEHRPER